MGFSRPGKYDVYPWGPARLTLGVRLC